jgi:serine/threonine-protein kinase
MTHCPSSDLLRLLLADRLAGAEAEAVEAHVETCPSCQQALEQLTGNADVRTGVRVDDAGADFLARLEKEPPTGTRPSSPTTTAGAGSGPGASPVEAAVADTRYGLPRNPDLNRIQMAPPATAEALRDLLRRRLRLASLLVTGFFGVAVSLGVVNVALHHWTAPARIWQGIAFFAGPLAIFVVITVILWSRRPLSLAVLRATELALVALITLGCAWKQIGYRDAAPDLIRGFGDAGLAVLAGYHGLFWFALLATYGLLVPNSRRRCAVVVAAIAACPVAVELAQSGRTGQELTGRPLVYYLTLLGFWVGFGALLAVFGSHHIAVLRRQVSEARRLGHYRLKERLGSGGMGEVYLAEHALLRRPCAVKLIRAERAGDPQNLRRFEREVQATATLTHPNTVEIFDYGHAEDGTFYYVMEYLPGPSLEELVRRHGPLPPGRAVHLLRQACGALQEAHGAGLIHRDVKPGNILVCERGGEHDVAKLLDFGLVRARGPDADGQQLTQEGTIAGTPAYMSPEQAAGRTDLDGRSDVYSVGALAYFLLTGRPPFVRQTAVQTLAAHLGEAVAPPDRGRPEVPADLSTVVLRCLEKDPARRFPDAASLERELARCGCVGQWSRERAAEWWRARSQPDAAGADPPTA